jgi:hypothetical protein
MRRRQIFLDAEPAPASSGGESAAVDLEADHGELAVLEAQACAGRDGEVEERFGAVMNVTIVFCSMNSLGPTQQSFQMP